MILAWHCGHRGHRFFLEEMVVGNVKKIKFLDKNGEAMF